MSEATRHDASLNRDLRRYRFVDRYFLYRFYIFPYTRNNNLFRGLINSPTDDYYKFPVPGNDE